MAERLEDLRIERARKGGLARKKSLTAAQRRRIAREAALTRHRRSTKAERSAAMRKAVRARWARVRAKKK